jgi:hypothetical protein
MHLEFTHTFEDYQEASQAYQRRAGVGGSSRLGLLVLFICVIVIGGSAFFEAASTTTPAKGTTPTPGVAPGGNSLFVNVVLPLIPWLLVFGFLWMFVFRRLAPRKPASFLFDSNAAADRAGRRPLSSRLMPIVVIAAVLLAFGAVLYPDVTREADPGGGGGGGGNARLVESLLPLAPWLVMFAIIWVFVFRLMRRQTRQNWEGQPNLHLEYRVDISPDGVSVACPVSSSAYRWEAFQRVQETPKLFILFLSTLTFVLIPKRTLPDAQAVDWLRGTLRTMIAERPTPAFAVVMPAPAA